MVFADLEAEDLQQPGAADAENDLLLQSISFIATIEMVGNLPVLRLVPLDVCVEKEDRHFSACRAFDSVQPGLNLDVSIFYCYQGFDGQ